MVFFSSALAYNLYATFLEYSFASATLVSCLSRLTLIPIRSDGPDIQQYVNPFLGIRENLEQERH